LGNFCFSDIYHDNTLYSRLSYRQKIGMIPHIHFLNNSYQVFVQYILNRNGVINTIKKPIRFLFYDLFFNMVKENRVIWSLYYTKFKKINPIFNYILVQKKSPIKALKISKIKRFISN